MKPTPPSAPSVKIVRRKGPPEQVAEPKTYDDACHGLFMEHVRRFERLTREKKEILLRGISFKWPTNDRIVAALCEPLFMKIWKHHECETPICLKSALSARAIADLAQDLNKVLARHEVTDIISRWEARRAISHQLASDFGGEADDYVLMDAKPERIWKHLRKDPTYGLSPYVIGTESEVFSTHMPPGYRLA